MKVVRYIVSPVVGTITGIMGFASAQAAEADSAVLDEVIVTSTRQVNTVNRVPLSVTAQTQEALDQQGIKTIDDLEGLVPGLRITGSEASGNRTVTIRGIRQQSATAATTGFYLDETPLAKRAAGGFGSQNGTPVPPLFDLQRVEVLRGPQGTLFGGGSEGGTIRYIQAAPGLTEYSSYGRAQFMTMDGGDLSSEAGYAIGGPLIEDKLGFRASVFARKTGGYIDLTDYRTGTIYDENANSGEVKAGRFALTWAPTADIQLTASYLKSRDETDSNSSTYNLSEPGQLVVDPLCFNIPYITSQPVAARTFLVPPMVLPYIPFACDGSNGTYVAPGYTVGPFNLERNQSLALGPTPTRTDLDIGSLDFQWDITEDLQIKSITSFTKDTGSGQSPQNYPLGFMVYPGTARIVTAGRPDVSVPTGSSFNPNVTDVPNGLGLGALIQTNTDNRRHAFSQELRIQGSPNELVSYVVGAYHSNTRASVGMRALTSERAFQQLSGMTILQRFGVPDTGVFANIFEHTEDVETAMFADVTLYLGDHWRASAGLRATYVSTDFQQHNYGTVSNTTSAAQAQVSGKISSTPTTPKASLQYFFTPDDLIYASAAKGFRAGGVNQVPTTATEGALSRFGLTSAAFPRTYESDSVWNYELGAKFRMWDGKAQINTAVYEIEWENVQTFYFTGDGAVFNVPEARSRGVELEWQVRPVTSLTLNGSVAHTTSEYLTGLRIPGGPGSANGDLVIATAGQKFAQPELTYDLGARFDFMLGNSVNAYARLDYRWLEGYATAVPGTSQYSPDSSNIPSQKNLNLRLGAEFRDFDVSLVVLNLTDEDIGSSFGGRSACTNADCSTYNTYTYGRTVVAPMPRQIGVEFTYRPQ